MPEHPNTTKRKTYRFGDETAARIAAIREHYALKSDTAAFEFAVKLAADQIPRAAKPRP